jgi:hypothetical protein
VRTKTTHIVANDGKWAVKREGETLNLETFPSKQLALEAARQLVKGESAWQIVSHGASGRIRVEALEGLPVIQRSPVKSKLGRRTIEKAVFEVLRKRL